ncbi:MAG: hypothetical protein OEY01_09485 [Desulfobulbaceae bacterium]|nr:hypothetical protein [Desulfobulbaceae bacterium]HIJ79235.1 hypothetical protein [Deltaproteobacteria bacterium]
MKDLYCHNCQQKIPAGGSFYCCRTEIISGFDGRLADPYQDPDLAIKTACEEINALPPHEAMDDVYQEIKIILCPSCRLKLRETLLAMKKPRQTGGKILRFPTAE